MSETPSWRVVRLSAEPGVIGAVFALPRVPTGGRRSLACGQHCRFGGPHRETWRRSLVGGVVRGERMCGFRTPSGRDAGRRPALRCRVPSARVAMRGFRWRTASGASLGTLRHHAERRAGKGTPTSGRHSPPEAGGREGPRVGLWFASRQGSASSAQFSRSRACRAPPGGLPRGRRSLACGQHCRFGGPHREHWRRFFATGVLWRRYAAEREKRTGSELCSLPSISGESVKGGYPLSQSVMTNRNLPPRADGAQGSFDSRRGAPGGLWAGPRRNRT